MTNTPRLRRTGARADRRAFLSTLPRRVRPAPARPVWLAILVALVLGQAAALAQSTAAAAAQPTPAPAEPPLKEVQVATTAFARGVPLPAWVDPAPLPAATATRRALAIRLEDTHLLVADRPVAVVNLAQQANDPATLGQIGQIAMPFVPQYQRLVLHKAAILRANGELVDHTQTAPVRFLQREAGLEQGVYSGVITASLLLPDVRVGDTLLLQYSIEGANPIFGKRFLQHLPWQRAVPVELRRVTLNTPAGRPIRWRFQGDAGLPDVTPTTTTAVNGLQRLRFEQRDLAPVELEPAQPRGAMPLAWLQFSEFADWGEVARWADALFPSNEPLPDELLPLIQRWLRLPTAGERASQALQFVQNEIRYVSVSLGESSHRPHSPAEVLRNRYGDCKDKTFLLMRLLQAMGLPARAALASLTAPQSPARLLASPLAFDHVVVQLRLDDRDYYLDGTRLGQRGPLDRLGQGLEDASVLVVANLPSTELTTVRSPNRAELFRNALSETFTLAAFDDDATLDSEQQWNGLGAETLRLTAARLPITQLERALLTALERRYPGAAIAAPPELVDQVDLNRITVRGHFKLPKLAVPNPVEGSWTMRFAPANMQNMLAMPTSTTRRFPLALPGFPTVVDYRAEMRWPTTVTGLGDVTTRRVTDPAFDAEIVRGFRGNVQSTTLRFEPRTGSVPAKDVPTLLADVRSVERELVGAMVVTRDQIRSSGPLGLSRKSLSDSLKQRAETTIERSSRAIAGGQIAGDDLATALCVRSEAQIELGRPAEALQDAQTATRQAPALAVAWYCQGNARWAGGDFEGADADFGKALALGHPARETYYHRGMVRYFAGRLEPALDDFGKAAADRSSPSEKAYARVWQALLLQRLGRPATPELVAATQEAANPAAEWPAPVLGLFGGGTTPEQLIETLERKPGDDRVLALTEAWFFVGEYQLGAGRPEQARKAFEAARALNISAYLEYTAAGFELQRLGRN